MATEHIVTRRYAGEGGLGERIYERLRSLALGSGIRCRPRIRTLRARLCICTSDPPRE
jgi:hypothetical protein